MAKRAADINEITRNLREMKLPAMAEALNQLFLSADFSTYSSLELVDTIVNEEKMSRKNHTVEKRLKQATLTNSQARLESIEYLPGRNINKALIDQLKTNEYIRDGRNVEILGATGCGKSYIANALAVNACGDMYKVRYYRMTDLLSELSAARITGNISRSYKTLGNLDLLIIDDFLLVSTNVNEQRDLMEIIELRTRGKSTILCSQLTPEQWHTHLGSGFIADSILDRVDNNTFTIDLKGDSLRRRT